MIEIFEAQNFLALKGQLTGLFWQVRQIAMVLVFPFFVFALVAEQVRGLTESPDYFKVIKRLALFFAALAIYDPIFIHSNRIAGQIADVIFPLEEFNRFKDTLWAGMTGEGRGETSILSALRGGISYLLLVGSYFLAGIAFYFLDLVRKMSLGFLYVLGPLWLAVSVLPDRGRGVARFFESVLTINAWVIVANLLMKIQALLAKAYYEKADAHLFPVIASNVVLGAMLFHTPKLTAMVAAGEPIGGLPYAERAYQKARDLMMVSLVAGFVKTQGLKVWDRYRSGGKEKNPANVAAGDEGVRPGDVA